MKTSSYIYGILVIIIVVLLFALGSKQTSAPTVQPGVSTTTTTSATASAQKSSGTTSAYYQIHVKKGGATVWYSSPTTTVASEIDVNNPPQNSVARSPMTVSGLAKGSWYFEGSMPILLTDATGKVIARGTVRAQSDWMTDAKVPFLGTLVFSRQPTGSTGAFVMRNDNPSGMAANAKEMEILVTFE